MHRVRLSNFNSTFTARHGGAKICDLPQWQEQEPVPVMGSINVLGNIYEARRA